jgi:hypothetical protein
MQVAERLLQCAAMLACPLVAISTARGSAHPDVRRGARKKPALSAADALDCRPQRIFVLRAEEK